MRAFTVPTGAAEEAVQWRRCVLSRYQLALRALTLDLTLDLTLHVTLKACARPMLSRHVGRAVEAREGGERRRREKEAREGAHGVARAMALLALWLVCSMALGLLSSMALGLLSSMPLVLALCLP